jgi:CRP-like cAMP-binding protein
MTEQHVIQTLRSIRFLHDVSDELIGKLADICHVVDFPEGSVIFREGQPARALYLIVEGKVALEICASGVGCKRIMTLEGGDLLGWSPVLEGERLTATARTLGPARTVEIDGPQIVTMGEEDPRLGYEFMKRAAVALTKRLNATRLQLVDVYGSQLPQTLDGKSPAQK